MKRFLLTLLTVFNIGYASFDLNDRDLREIEFFDIDTECVSDIRHTPSIPDDGEGNDSETVIADDEADKSLEKIRKQANALGLIITRIE